MKQRRDIAKEVESTLNSLDGIQRAEPAEFFFTRLQARMQRSVPMDAWERFIMLITRPSVAITAMMLILAINAIMFTLRLKHSSERRELQISLQQAFADEYHLGINTFYEFDKSEQ